MIKNMLNNDNFIDYISKNCPSPFYVKPIKGNTGDTFIFDGLKSSLKMLGLKITMCTDEANTILIPGSSASLWDNGSFWAESATQFAEKKIVIGPSTFSSNFCDWHEKIKLQKNIKSLFARDCRSHEVIKSFSLIDYENIGLGHDSALYLSETDLFRKLRKVSKNEYCLVALRRDHEAHSPKYLNRWPTNTIGGRFEGKMKRLFRGVFLKQRLNMAKRYVSNKNVLYQDISLLSNPVLFLEKINNAERIITDRLHVMIVGAMLGKKIYAIDTFYNKLQAVYKHSMIDWFDVQFICKKEV